jgi:hypothetical protein
MAILVPSTEASGPSLREARCVTNARSPLQDLLVEEHVAPATAFAYVGCDVPAGMTLDEWRLARNRAPRAAEIDAQRERRNALVAKLRRRIGQR